MLGTYSLLLIIFKHQVLLPQVSAFVGAAKGPLQVLRWPLCTLTYEQLKCVQKRRCHPCVQTTFRPQRQVAARPTHLHHHRSRPVHASAHPEGAEGPPSAWHSPALENPCRHTPVTSHWIHS